MKIDWHTHSRYSDGADTLETLFFEAKQAGITHLAVVDHDTVNHHKEGHLLAKHYDITFIPGIEISAYDYNRKRKVHLLGYGFKGPCPAIEALCRPLLARRHAHSIWQTMCIQDAGFQISVEAALTYANTSGTLYKQHIMNALIDEPYDNKNYQTLYKSLFKGSGVAAGDIAYIDVFHALEAIHADGGFAVLAHPGQLDGFDVAEELIAQGLDGIELVHPDHSELDRDRIKQLAAKHHLFLTGGSDYHGKYGASVQLGSYVMRDLPSLLTV